MHITSHWRPVEQSNGHLRFHSDKYIGELNPMPVTCNDTALSAGEYIIIKGDMINGTQGWLVTHRDILFCASLS